MFSSTSKTLLRNVIRHTDTHNRIKEESEMWQAHTSRKDRTDEQRGHKRLRDDSPQASGVKSTISKVPRAHMDRDTSPDTSSTTYWKRKLQEMEERDPNRWGHAGYKELYPEQFISDRSSSPSSSSSSSERIRKRTKSKRKKVPKHEKSKKKHKHKDTSSKKRKKHKSREKESGYAWVPKSAATSHK